MSTDAQIAANRINAQSSCGPRTAEGRARVSRNAVSHGLFSSGDFVRPDEQDLYSEFCAGFRTDLAPQGAIEETLAAEIVHAAWRLRRCSVIESTLVPGEGELDPLLDRTQQSVDRARAHAHRIFHRSIAELRRVQTERRLRTKLPKDIRRVTDFTEQTQSTGRNSPCTCGSGVKFKRCCGKGAPAVLNHAA